MQTGRPGGANGAQMKITKSALCAPFATWPCDWGIVSSPNEANKLKFRPATIFTSTVSSSTTFCEMLVYPLYSYVSPSYQYRALHGGYLAVFWMSLVLNMAHSIKNKINEVE